MLIRGDGNFVPALLEREPNADERMNVTMVIMRIDAIQIFLYFWKFANGLKAMAIL